MYFLLKIGIFHCYVSLPEGNHVVLAESMSFGESHDFGEPNVKENTLADLIIAQKSVGQPQQKEIGWVKGTYIYFRLYRCINISWAVT